MLRLLLDIHVPPEVARQVRRHRPECIIASLRDWNNGTYLDAADETILLAAQQAGWTLVTFDQKTIRPVLRRWGLEGRSHAGVLFVSSRSIASNDIGRLARRLIYVWDQFSADDWSNRVDYLRQ